MRNVLNINEGWQFIKDCADPAVTEGAVVLTLPHTWNATDGQDGGNDYFRGSCIYKKTVSRSMIEGDEVYLEICGANSSADVYVNGKALAHHDGGYSTWRVNITEELGAGEAEIAIHVNNEPNDFVYPQMADFTFYGGLYRNVNLIGVATTHFDLDYFGAPGIKVTPEINGSDAGIEIEVYTKALESSDLIRYTIFDKEGNAVATVDSENSKESLKIENVTLWNGRKNPYLYTYR